MDKSLEVIGLRKASFESPQAWYLPSLLFEQGEDFTEVVRKGERSFALASATSVGGFIVGLDRSEVLYTRKIYGILDFLADVGGLMFALYVVAGLVLALLGRTKMTYFLIKHLFLISGETQCRTNPQQPLIEQALDHTVHQSHACTGLSCCFANFRRLLCCCYAYAKWQRRMEKGEHRIDKQLDIVNFLRKQMLLDVLIKVNFTRLQRYLARH